MEYKINIISKSYVENHPVQDTIDYMAEIRYKISKNGSYKLLNFIVRHNSHGVFLGDLKRNLPTNLYVLVKMKIDQIIIDYEQKKA